MIAIAIDDEPIALEIIKSHASKLDFVDLRASFTNAFEALEYMRSQPVDLLFLDIKMPDISGIEFLRSLIKKPLVIFTTAYAEHALISFELDAVDYLLKPFSVSRFLKASQKAQELYDARKLASTKPYIFVKDGYEKVKVNFSEILYVEAAGNYITFYTTGDKVMSRMTIYEIETLLPASEFIRVHRSFIVSTGKIDRIEKHQLHIHGNRIPVGQSYGESLKSIFEETKASHSVESKIKG